MPRSLLALVLKHAAPDADPDAVLLRRYAATRDDDAFAAIVRRHGPMVWAVCRQSVPNRADAEDVFQATFVALATAASKVRGPERLGGWLYAAAVRIAGKAKRGHARRTKHERAAARPPSDNPVSAAAWNDLLAAVHEAVAALPPSLRAAFVLCDLQGTDPTDAAKQTGVKANTLTGQLARARQRVAAALGKRGLAGGAVALAAAGGLPEALANQVAGGVVQSAAVLELASEVTAMGVSKLKLLAAALLLAGGLAVGGLGVVTSAGAQPPPPGGIPGAGPALPPGGGGELPPKPNTPPLTGTVPVGPGGGLPGPGGGLGGTSVGGPAFDYRFAAKPGTLAEVAKVLQSGSDSGWEYVGPLDVDPADPPKGKELFAGITKDTRVVLVFKRHVKPVLPPVAIDPSRTPGPGIFGGGTTTKPPAPAPGGGGGLTPAPKDPEAAERFEVVPLKKADAEEVAKVLNEVFNGPGKEHGRVRIVADKKSNSLIVVKASDADLKVMRQLLEKTLDAWEKPPAK